MLHHPPESARRIKTYVEKYRKKTGTSAKPILKVLEHAGPSKGVIQVVKADVPVNGR